VGDQATNALVATALGLVLAVLLLIPTAAVQYRLDGRLGPRDLAVLVGAAVYAFAIWTYTLLPLPAEGSYACLGAQTRLLGTIGEIRLPDSGGPLALLRDPALLQVVLNVLLFVPLGWFVRVVTKRGVVVATLVGAAVSLLVELTQRTGVWGVYDCAYRLFDVDDLLVNTLGATLGSLLSLLVVRRRTRAVVLPTTLTLGRRLVAALCDVVFVALTGAAAVLLWRAVEVYVREVPVDRGVQAALQWGVPLGLQAVVVLTRGVTVGELTADLRTVARRPRLELPGRAVKLVTGVGSLALLAAGPYGVVAVALWAVVSLVAAWRSRGHRGLSNALGGLDLEVDQDVRSRRGAAR
jgi:glycopeptide antibiotics resistance protein